METLRPTLKRGRDVWDKINMPEAEFLHRVERIRESMEKQGIELLFLYGNGADNYGNPCYVSNFLIKMPAGALVAIPLRGDVTLIVQGFPRDQPAVKSITWVEDIRSCRDISLECVEYLKERGPLPSTIGFVGLKQYMPYSQFRFLTDSLEQCKIVDADHIIDEMRIIKSQREQDQVCRSSRIINRIFEFITTYPFSRMNERDLEATADYIARIEGAEDIRILIAKPSVADWALRIAEDAEISNGEKVILYAAVAFERYWAEGIRTLVTNSSSFTELPPEDGAALYDRILSMIGPGKPISQFYREVRDEIEKSHLSYLPHYGTAHGIGLSLAESPAMSEEEKSPFLEGMCLTLRLALNHETGGFMKGNTVLISEEKVEVLTS